MYDSFIVVRRDDRMVVEEKMREQLVQADLGLNAPPARPQRPRDRDQSVSPKAIIAITAAVIVMVFGFTALVSSMFPGLPPASTGTLPAPTHPTQIEPFADLQQIPVPVPEQLPPPAPAAPVPDGSASLAETAPVLDNTGDVPPALQADGLASGAEALLSGATEAAEASGIPLTSAEQAAVARGLKELERTAAINSRARSAPNRLALTAAERASVERGLRELEKAAKRGNQPPRPR